MTVDFIDLSAPTEPSLWAVRHPGIGLLEYRTEEAARVAAGTAGTLLTRDSTDQPWREVPMRDISSRGGEGGNR